MLVGTALSVIIPEGVRSLISKSHGESLVSFKNFTAKTQALKYQSLFYPVLVVTPTKKDDGTINVLLHHHEDKDIHGIIGMSLVLGFLFMLLIDQISSSRSKG